MLHEVPAVDKQRYITLSYTGWNGGLSADFLLEDCWSDICQLWTASSLIPIDYLVFMRCAMPTS